uniref:Threonine ammonia-lyase n=1 Tax=Desulfacinum infernum TaxID=35837 RepID=A0A831ZW85_9BACT
MAIALDDIRQAARLLQGRILRTPLVYSPTFSRLFGAEVYLKLENLQKTGSFKIRGASYKILRHREAIGPQGVVAASAGNHAQGVALAARNAGVPAFIVMPEWASLTKQEATRSYGGTILLHGKTLGESLEKARELSAQGYTFIHPYDDADIITGQGTIGLEIVEDCPDVHAVLVPIGGGGLMAGIASAVKALRPETEVIGVQAAVCPSAIQALQEGRVVRVEGAQSIADGITVKELGRLTFEILSRTVSRIILVDEEHIAEAVLFLLERKKVLAEGAGAVPLGALLMGETQWPAGAKIVLVVSGGNVDSPLLGRILTKGLVKGGRVTRLTVELPDVPGSLAGLLAVIASHGANVLHISHNRHVPHLPIHVTLVTLEVETRGFAHAEDILSALKASGHKVVS